MERFRSMEVDVQDAAKEVAVVQDEESGDQPVLTKQQLYERLRALAVGGGATLSTTIAGTTFTVGGGGNASVAAAWAAQAVCAVLRVFDEAIDFAGGLYAGHVDKIGRAHV